MYPSIFVEFWILSVVTYKFTNPPLYFSRKCGILWSATRKGAKEFMIKREMYMSRIRPFIGSELIKVMTGIRRCGKSVMLELIKQELTESGISPSQFISINFEDMGYSHLQTASHTYWHWKSSAEIPRLPPGLSAYPPEEKMLL